MSDTNRYFIADDGTHMLLDVKTGKYYILSPDEGSPSRVKQSQKLSNTENGQNGYSSSKPQRNPTTGKGKETSQSKVVQQESSNSQQTQSKGANTPRPIQQPNEQSEHTSTPRATEHEQIQENENEDKDNDGESSTMTARQQDSTAMLNKRTLNDSDDFTTVGQNKSRKKDHYNEKHSMNQGVQTTTHRELDGNKYKYSIPFEHIQRAIVHNLPCFIINFGSSNRLPPAVTVAEDLHAHFEQHHTRLVNGFSVVRYIGNQLKVGVKNKGDYLALCDQKVWPSGIQGNPITVNIPKFVPEQFALVVRYVPPVFTIDQVSAEVKKSASSASNFRAIIYPYSRSTNDFRFTVSDQREYNGLLRLGTIGVMNKMHPVTPYKPANKLTFCSKCWSLGHTRDKCQCRVQKCRICLLDFNEQHNEVCSKTYKCAQCGQEHYSLNADCEAVQQYRNNLNRAVKEAAAKGSIKLTGIETSRITPPLVPRLDNQSFPSLISSTSSNLPRPSPWRTIDPSSSDQQVHQSDISNNELFEKIRIHFDEKAKQVDDRISKMELEAKSTEKTITNMGQSLRTIVGLLKVIMKEIIPPLSNSSFKTNSKVKGSVENIASNLVNEIETLQKEIHMDFKQTEENNGVTAVAEDQLQVERTDHHVI